MSQLDKVHFCRKIYGGQPVFYYVTSRLDGIQNWPVLARKAQYRPGALATLIGISVRHLQRHVVREHKRTLHEWLTQIRIAEAQTLLTQGLGHRAVAARLRFKQYSHFSRTFSRVLGIAPTVYRMGIFKNGSTANGHSHGMAAAAL